MAHMFAVGQTVTLTPKVLRSAVTGDYEVVRLLPDGSEGPQYRIKSKQENYERVVLERELTLVDARSFASARFRSSHTLAARSPANFGIEGTLAT